MPKEKNAARADGVLSSRELGKRAQIITAHLAGITAK